MSDLFHAGQARRTSGSITITMKNGKELAKKLEKLKDGGEKAIKYTVSDFASRAPGWVSKGIRQHYGVDKDAIEEAQSRTKRGSGATQIKVKGISVDGAALEYKGRTLTPIHFRMSPSTLHPKGLQSKRNRIPGQAIAENASNPNAPFGMVRVPVPYQVSATVIKGSRKKMKKGTYLAPSNKENADAPILPFQRTGAGRTPVHAVRTLSVPQMIGSEEKKSRASDTISEIINENLEKRFENHIKRAVK